MSDTTGLAVLNGNDEDKNRPKAMNGSVVVVPKREVSPEELEKAENELRALAKKLFKDIEQNYWDLGQCLYDVYDGVPGGYRGLVKGDGSRAVRKALFEKWGFKSFADYCEKEVGILKRSAENMRYAYYWFEIKLHLPKELKEKIKILGRSKAYLLAGFVGEDNVLTWLDKAASMTHEELKKAIKAAKSKKGSHNEGDESLSDAAERGSRAKSGEDDGPIPAPKPEEQHQFHTSLYKGQWDTVQMAMDRAKGMSHSEKIGHNLEMICIDFLSNNEFGKAKDFDRKQYIAKIERLLGLKLVAIDLKEGKPVYGGDFLWKLVQERVTAEKEGAGEEAPESAFDNVTPIKGKKRKKAKADDAAELDALAAEQEEELAAEAQDSFDEEESAED